MNNKIKCVLVGDTNVGKSTFLYKLTNVNYIHPIESTIGVEFGTLLFTHMSNNYKLLFWDTAGQERYRSVIRTYYRDVDIFILMYSIDNKKSFSNIEKWWKDIQDINSSSNKICFLLGNKKDLTKKRQILYKEGGNKANNMNWVFFEISNFTDVSLNHIIEKIIEKYKLNYTSLMNENDSILLTQSSINTKKIKKKCC